MGLMQGGMTVGAVVGPFVGGVLADYFGMRESFFVASVALGLISLLIGFALKKNQGQLKSLHVIGLIGVFFDSQRFSKC